MKIDLSFKYKDLLEHINKEKPFNPEFTIILGSGLGDFASTVDIKKSTDVNTTKILRQPRRLKVELLLLKAFLKWVLKLEDPKRSQLLTVDITVLPLQRSMLKLLKTLLVKALKKPKK